MKDRIAHIMRAKNLKATDFAALLGIQPSGVSHILAGRNNPSLEFVKKIKETFPEYNLDWIIFGTGPMTTSEPYKEAFLEATRDASATEPVRADSSPLEPSLPGPSPTSSQLSLNQIWESDGKDPTPASEPNAIKSILVLYEDGSFESFSPR